MHFLLISDTNEMKYRTPHKKPIQRGAGNLISLENQISKDMSQRSDVWLRIHKQQSTYEKNFFLCLLLRLTLYEMAVLCTVCLTYTGYIESQER